MKAHTTSNHTGTASTTTLDDLATAKRNVAWLLDHADGLVDFHGIAYWAGRVEALRKEARAAL